MSVLAGGALKIAEHDVEWYFTHMTEYTEKVRSFFKPYIRSIKMISDEVKTFGGSGTIHGCIVDIDWFNHIYLDPYNGEIAPYFAMDTVNKVFYKNVRNLLKDSVVQPYLADGTLMLEKFDEAAGNKSLPILSKKDFNRSDARLNNIPEIVLDTRMYNPSRIMRSFQYIFDQNIIRLWKDEILAVDVEPEQKIVKRELIRQNKSE